VYRHSYITPRFVTYVQRLVATAERAFAERELALTPLKNVAEYFQGAPTNTMRLNATNHLTHDTLSSTQDTTPDTTSGTIRLLRRFNNYGDQTKWIAELIASNPDGIRPAEIKARAADAGMSIRNPYNILMALERRGRMARFRHTAKHLVCRNRITSQ
jgi:hypothetical protein